MEASIKARFFGRQPLIQDIIQGVLAAPQPLDFSLVGPKMIGKSRLMKYLAADTGPLKGAEYADWRPATYKESQYIFVGHYDCDWPDARLHLTNFINQQFQLQLRDTKSIKIDWNRVDASASPGQQIGALVRQLEQQGIRLVLLLDNFDHIFRSDNVTEEMINELRPLSNEMGLVVASEYSLHDLDSNQSQAASPLFNVMHQLFIGLLDSAAAREWIDTYGDSLSPEIKDELFKLAGGHPFLLARINDIIIELQQYAAPETPLAGEHLPLIKLRLAEHGRQLFETIWRKLTDETHGIAAPALALAQQLAQTPVRVGGLPAEQVKAMNWLINQAIVRFDQNYYELFSPLFATYLLGKSPAEAATVPPPPALAQPPQYGDIFNQLPPKEAALLKYFQDHSRTTVTFDDLLAHVWQKPDASPRRVQEAIRRLRNILSEQTPPVGVIKSERGQGYRYIPAQN